MKESPGVPGLSNMASTVANEPLVREHESERRSKTLRDIGWRLPKELIG
jgi:hypothetical protein